MAHIDLLSSGSLGAFKNLLANSLNAESAEQLGAKPYERFEGRTSRKDFRTRNVVRVVPNSYQAGLRTKLQEMFNAPDMATAR